MEPRSSAGLTAAQALGEVWARALHPDDREHLLRKLGTDSLAGLTKFAIREGLISVEK